MNVRARLVCGCSLAGFLLMAFGCSSHDRSPLDPAAKLAESNASAGAGFLGGGPGIAEPRSAGWVRFFPLDSGSVWTYAFESRTITIGESTGTDTSFLRGRVITQMLGPVSIDGTPYARSVETTVDTLGSFSSSVDYRQDATGLYEYDTFNPAAARRAPDPRTASIEAACSARIARTSRPETRDAWMRARADLESRLTRLDAALRGGSPQPATGPAAQPEIRRLAYPLQIGNRWVLRSIPIFVTEFVEGRDVIAVAGRRFDAWRIRIDDPFLGPDDRVWVWFSTEGELRFRYHIASVATDPEGDPIGGLILDWDQRLTGFQLAGRLRLRGTNPPPLPLPGPPAQTRAARGSAASSAPYSFTTR